MNKQVYNHLLQTYGRNPGYWAGFVAILISSILNKIVVVIFMAQVATGIANNDIESAQRSIVYFLIAYIMGAVLWTIGELIAVWAENGQYEKMKVSYHDKLIGKDMSFYRDNQTGYLATAFRQYLDSALQLVRFLRAEPLGVVVSLLAPVIVLFFANLMVGAITLLVVIVQLVYIFWSSAKTNQYRKATHEIYRKATAEVSDEITNIVAFKAGGVESLSHSTFIELAAQENRIFWLKHKASALLDLPRGTMTAIGMAAAMYVITTIANTGAEALGLMVLTLTYMFQILRSVSALPALVQSHDDYITKLAPTLRYLSTDYETIRDPDTPVSLIVSKAALRVEDVGFMYGDASSKAKKVTVFKDLNLEIAGGEQIGVVGLSGAGKSTLASLLMRFDDVTSGAITIDGIDIRAVKQSELRQKIAYVPQEPILFHRSIRENIAYYNPSAPEREIIRAAKAAHAHDFIQELPEGYDTLVGERGVKLSGGQKQRIAIARAILKKAPIMVFDEATSALDSESEQIIQQTLPEILGKQTAVIIAHRLSTIAKLDRIIVMHGGKIVEQGTHQQLLKLGGRYHSLWQRQIAAAE